MTLPAHLRPGQVVAEIDSLSDARPPWRWFELDLDRGWPLNQHAGLSETVTGPHLHVIGMTRHHLPELFRSRIAWARALTHVQFEVRDPATARRAVAIISAAGLTPLPAIHLPGVPASAADLHQAADLLTGLDAPLVKLAYRAPDPVRAAWGVTMLTSWNHPHTALALIPMGTESGRAAALAAGSALIWAPRYGDGERWTTTELLPVLSESAMSCPCQGASRS